MALWLQTPGYVDYVMPQVYWGYGYTTKGGSTDYAFENVTRTWAAMPRDASVSLYFGLGASRIGDGDGGNYDHNTDQWNTGHELADFVRWTTRFLVLRNGVISASVPAVGAEPAELEGRVRAELAGGER